MKAKNKIIASAVAVQFIPFSLFLINIPETREPMTGSLSHAHRHGIPAGGILCREKDLPDILRDIRDTHRKDAITADES